MNVLRPNHRAPAGSGGGVRAIFFYSLVLLFLFTATDSPKCQSLSENQVKALFLYNFSKYIEWPARSFHDTQSPLIIGVVAEKDFAASMEQAVSDKNVRGRAIQIVRISGREDVSRCHVLFIAASEKDRVPEIVAATKNLAVLTVSDFPQSSQSGAVINLFRNQGKLRFVVDLAAARQAGLDISSKLLSLAYKVYGKE